MNMVKIDQSKLKLWTFLWGHGECEWPGYMYVYSVPTGWILRVGECISGTWRLVNNV